VSAFRGPTRPADDAGAPAFGHDCPTVEVPPETRYVAVGDADVAYQVMGAGPLHLLYYYGLGTHIDVKWEYPPLADLLVQMASYTRLILFDRRGTGASDGVPRDAMPTWEEWADDIRAVIDAAGSPRPAIFAQADAGPIAMLFAAMRPERVRALILADTSARYLADDDYPIGLRPQMIEAIVEGIGRMWGTPDLVRLGASGGDEAFVQFAAKLSRAAATPRTAAAQLRYIYGNVDVRGVLSLIQVPTLVLHHRANQLVPVEHGRYLAEHIAGAKLVELPGDAAQLSPADSQLWFGEVAEFLTGERPPLDIDRVLTTVLVTDIVGSTKQVAAVGDQHWRSVLNDHDRAVRDQLRRFHGHEIKMTGDGVLASFDGPARAIRCVRAITESVRGLGIELRSGLHTGECDVRGQDLSGLAVHIAARIAALAGPGQTLVSNTVKDLVAGSGIALDERGPHELRGVPGTWQLYSVAP